MARHVRLQTRLHARTGREAVVVTRRSTVVAEASTVVAAEAALDN